MFFPRKKTVPSALSSWQSRRVGRKHGINPCRGWTGSLVAGGTRAVGSLLPAPGSSA